MQTDPAIIEYLNEVLSSEFTAINQYFIHSKLFENWGVLGLAKKERDESMDEMRHAEQVIDRILYFEGTPNMQRIFPVRVGQDVEEILRLDLEGEKEAIERYTRGIALCVEKNEQGTREFLADKLRDEEMHADWLETQLDLLNRVGLQNYVATWARE